jgi:hypothetical protein
LEAYHAVSFLGWNDRPVCIAPRVKAIALMYSNELWLAAAGVLWYAVSSLLVATLLRHTAGSGDRDTNVDQAFAARPAGLPGSRRK